MKKRVRKVQFRRVVEQYRKIGLDSMLFSYHFHGTSPYINLSEIIIQKISKEEIKAATSIITYLEILSYPGLENKSDKLSFIKSFFLSEDSLDVVNLGPSIADYAAKLRRLYKLPTPDAIQFASSQLSDAEIFITNDKHFKRLSGSEKLPIVFLDQFIN